ncbi:MAG: hypothetical protein RL091_1675, partial [Verrucomicrobiota bacterium]
MAASPPTPSPVHGVQASPTSDSVPAILIINCGSSSLKFALIATHQETLLLSGLAERLGTPEATISWRLGEEKKSKALAGEDLRAALHELIAILPVNVRIIAVGHRVVHGAEAFSHSVLIDAGVLAGIERCCALAPLHNPANLAGIRAAQKMFPETPQVAVFDTAFHQTIPRHAFLYAVPYDWYENDGFRRYGFHGTSHRYVAGEAARRLNQPLAS